MLFITEDKISLFLQGGELNDTKQIGGWKITPFNDSTVRENKIIVLLTCTSFLVVWNK